jgi:hypothetical protein
MPKGEIFGIFIGIMCLSLMARTTKNQTSRAQKTRKLKRDSGFLKYIQGPRDRLAGGEKDETHENLENLLSYRY